MSAVPERHLVQPVEVDGGQHVFDVQGHQMEVREQLDLPPSHIHVDPELAGRGREILLEDLKRDDAGPGQAMLADQLQRAPSLGRRVDRIGVEENVGVEEAASATSAHGARPG
jgi:hypothetical protein